MKRLFSSHGRSRLHCSHSYIIGQLFAQKEDEVLTVDSSTVLLNATVLDNNGKSATGLKREQFSVFENGVQQQISYFSAPKHPLRRSYFIDTSGSMESRISIARAAAINFLTGLRANDSAAIYRFSSKVELIQDFSGKPGHKRIGIRAPCRRHDSPE
jgi:VWFA-related protein